jgi:tetratricopeptide (TPR) repeat protein
MMNASCRWEHVTATRTTSRLRRAPRLPATDLDAPVSAPLETEPEAGAGSGFLDEARNLMAEHRWSEACRMLEAARAVHPSIETHRLLARAATHANERKLADVAIAALRSDPDPDAATLTALADVAIARGSYQAADLLARQAVELDAHQADAWTSLSASYAALGWFDEAGQCLDRAHALGVSHDRRWFIGRAVNRWSLTRTWAPLAAGLLIPFLGLLALAIGLTIPFIVREVRLTRLDDRFADLAADAWASELRLRVTHGISVFAIVALWILLLPLS